jgi:hypothetical protein
VHAWRAALTALITLSTSASFIVPASADDPEIVYEYATAPVVTTKPVQVSQSGRFPVAVSISNGGARLSFAAGTTLTVDGAPFRGLIYQPFAALDPSGGTYAGVFQLGASSIGPGREIRVEPPATLAFPTPVGSDPTGWQPVFLDAPGRPSFLLGQSDVASPSVAVDRLSDGLNRYALAKIARPAAPTLVPILSLERGFHSRWAGQSSRPDLAPGQLVDLVVRLVNTGTRTWVRDVPGAEVRLGSSAPLDNTRDFDAGVLVAPIVGKTRLARHDEAVVEVGEVGTFTMRLRAPPQSGTYRAFVRPVADGVTWMEDQGIFIELSVK